MTSRKVAQTAVEALAASNTRLVGCVLNRGSRRQPTTTRRLPARIRALLHQKRLITARSSKSEVRSPGRLRLPTSTSNFRLSLPFSQTRRGC
jgi:hypothetical protein